ncbi:cupredoxin domain-containing protein [Streptomyces sp. DSM 40750]|uniref:cupredoxin domain-containing protein n=1 Tax=Streptomyces sp. DSM 40750 TaxID=2801030 RepID=UPI00214CF8D5|nr:cupredoxin domain-containing protein [Streptomyces sp. DSM 40750]UUU25231.1 cupredoxin domain-containing protein [Streptomyces sp. DSM 40750]
MSPSHRRRRAAPLALGAVVALLLTTACANGDDDSPTSPSPAVSPSPTTSSAPPSPESAGAPRITMENFAFSPADPEVRPGEKVTVANKDSTPHTVTAADGDAFDTGNIAGGESGTFTAPAEAGEYAFVCTLHPDMKGTLIVR